MRHAAHDVSDRSIIGTPAATSPTRPFQTTFRPFP